VALTAFRQARAVARITLGPVLGYTPLGQTERSSNAFYAAQVSVGARLLM
jgi:hypothetical protein